MTGYLALDIGTRRVGVAVASGGVSIARPVTTVLVDEMSVSRIMQIAHDERCEVIIVGYPRNQSGDPTAQTQLVESYAEGIRQQFSGSVVFQDESLTSVVAAERLKARGVPYDKADIDAEAACIILTDYLESHRG